VLLFYLREESNLGNFTNISEPQVPDLEYKDPQNIKYPICLFSFIYKYDNSDLFQIVT